MTSPTDVIAPPATLPVTYDPSNAKLNASGTGKAPELLDSQAFLQLLVAQLKYQDPTNPVDTSNFMNQTAMLSQVQTMTAMSSTLSEMMSAQQTSSATAMLGKAIAFLDPAGNQVAGIVDSVSLNRGVAMLHVGDLAVPLAGVIAVGNPVPVEGAPDADAGDGTGPVEGADGTGSTGGTDTTGGSDATGGTDSAGGAGSAVTPGDTPSVSDTPPQDTAPPADTVPSQGLPDPAAGAGGSTAPTTRPDTISA